MQMGFEQYINLIYEQSDLFDHLMRVNEVFCIAWANAQLQAGATAIVYFDPVSSPSMVPRDLFLKTGYVVAQRTISRIQGPTVAAFASGRSIAILGDVIQIGPVAVSVSTTENLAEIKALCKGKITVIGNMNAIEMRRWTPDVAEAKVKQAIAQAGAGGGFILSDNHGEIPWQVSESVLLGISEAVHRWGIYPLSGLDE
jgi:uroporphyrinogen decarboxylase